MTTVVLFVSGVVMGSFLNVVGLRWNWPRQDGALSNFGGRSFCLSCGKILEWWELVPIVSFLMLGAKCSKCRSLISWQYPLVELWTGLVFISVPYIFLPIFCVYTVILIYDFRHKVIPDALVYIGVTLALISRLATGGNFWDWLAGPIIFSFFWLIWFLSRGRAMGFGDAKLGLSIGLLLGASQGFSAIVLAFWIGALSSVVYLFLDKMNFLKRAEKLTIKSEIPFAPFIIIGALISLVFDLDILHVALS